MDILRVTLEDGIPFRINFLEYESRRSGKGMAEVLLHLFHNVLEIIDRGKQGSGENPFWRQSTNKLLRYGIIVLSRRRTSGVAAQFMEAGRRSADFAGGSRRPQVAGKLVSFSLPGRRRCGDKEPNRSQGF